MSNKKDKHNKYYWDTERNMDHTIPSGVQKVMMSVPEGKEFNKPYTIDQKKKYAQNLECGAHNNDFWSDHYWNFSYSFRYHKFSSFFHSI